MATSFKKKLFLLVFCLASITQGMYSTYFVSILTTIERIYQIQSKTAGAVLSATEIGQIFGSLFIAYYGGRGNKPKWISFCMTLSALAALISISPHFILLATNNDTNISNQQQAPTGSHIHYSSSSNISIAPSLDLTSDLSTTVKERTTASRVQKLLARLELPNVDQLCRVESHTGLASAMSALKTHEGNVPTSKGNQTSSSSSSSSIDIDQLRQSPFPVSLVIAIFFTCLLAIGFGSTAITTLGIPFIDDIISKEESPLYLGLTIGLRIFGPALGFILGSFCISLNANSLLSTGQSVIRAGSDRSEEMVGSWWLGLVVISLPLLLLAIPMYFLSRVISSGDSERDDYEDITYQAAEDHDIGGSHDFPAHIVGLAGDLEITSSRTCFSSEIDSSSQEVLQLCQGPSRSSSAYAPRQNYQQNIAFEQPILSGDGLVPDKTKSNFAKTREEDEENNEATTEGDQHLVIDNNEPQWQTVPNVCLVVNHFGVLESSSFAQDEGQLSFLTHCHQRPQQQKNQPQISTRSSIASSISESYTSGEMKSRKRQVTQSQPSQQQQSQLTQDKPTITDLSSSLSRLLKNRLLVLRMLSGVLHILPIAGFYTFLPKYLIEQFRITSSSASVISGLAGILFVGFGAFIGGTIIRMFNVNSKLMTRWIAASALLYTIGMIILMNLSCEQNQMVHFSSHEYVSTDCSLSCKCTETSYNPVCANGTTYVSPCLAGCKSYSISDGKVLYDECGCTNFASDELSLNDTIKQTLTTLTRTPPDSHVNLNVATQGQCLTKCDNIFWYVILFSVFTLIHSSCEVGSMMFNLRCVKSDERTLALGLITFTSSLLGTIPCSIIYGSIADLTCVHWDRIATPSTSDGSLGIIIDEAQHGACRAYDNDSFRYYLHGLTALVMSFAFIVDCVISTHADEVDFYDGHDDSKLDIRVGLKKSTETIQ